MKHLKLYLLLMALGGSASLFGQTAAVSPEGFASLHAHGQKGTTGGAGGIVYRVDNLADLMRLASIEAPAVLQIVGKIRGPAGERIRLSSNKTLIGMGRDAAILGPEIHLIKVSNIIVRNLSLGESYDERLHKGGKGPDFDGIQADGCHHLWIDHCAIRRTNDGLIDLRKSTDCVTISWCVFSDHNKTLGIGWTDETSFRVTMHHNWFHHTNQRNPAFDNGFGHLYNNWFQSITACGPNARGKARLLVEHCVFDEVRNPLRCEPNAALASVGNEFVKCHGDQHSTKANLLVSYDYTLDEVATLRIKIRQGTGPQASP